MYTRPLPRSTAMAGSIDSVVFEPEPACRARFQCCPPSSEDEKKTPLLTGVHRLPPDVPSSTMYTFSAAEPGPEPGSSMPQTMSGWPAEVDPL